MSKCCECGLEIEDDSKAILGVPFGPEIVSFCSQKCYDDSKV
tara:strand:+ start:1157 stop:1282 length:126 start_codon:yes stop_codon:yes gene_type:complete